MNKNRKLNLQRFATEMVSRTNADPLIFEQFSKEIIQSVTEESMVLKHGKRLADMTSNRTSMPVLDALPLAYFVNGDTGMKQTSKMAWDKKMIYAEEIAVIVPIPEAVLDDAEYDIWEQSKPRIIEAFGKVIDAAILFNVNKPDNWRDGIVTSATDAGATVEATSSMYADIMSEDGVIAKVEASGYFPNAHIADISMRAKLRGLLDTTGQPIFKTSMQDSSQYSLDGEPMDFPRNGAWDKSKAYMVSGDFTQLVYSIRQDVTFKIFDQGIIQDPNDDSIVYNLMQNDMVAIRAVMRIGWQLPNPVNALNEDSDTRFPFAVYVPASEVDDEDDSDK